MGIAASGSSGVGPSTRKPRIGVMSAAGRIAGGSGRFTRELLTTLIATDREHEYIFFADGDTA